MDFRNAIKNSYMFQKFSDFNPWFSLNEVSACTKFHGYIFNTLGEKMNLKTAI